MMIQHTRKRLHIQNIGAENRRPMYAWRGSPPNIGIQHIQITAAVLLFHVFVWVLDACFPLNGGV